MCRFNNSTSLFSGKRVFGKNVDLYLNNQFGENPAFTQVQSALNNTNNFKMGLNKHQLFVKQQKLSDDQKMTLGN